MVVLLSLKRVGAALQVDDKGQLLVVGRRGLGIPGVEERVVGLVDVGEELIHVVVGVVEHNVVGVDVHEVDLGDALEVHPCQRQRDDDLRGCRGHFRCRRSVCQINDSRVLVNVMNFKLLLFEKLLNYYSLKPLIMLIS